MSATAAPPSPTPAAQRVAALERQITNIQSAHATFATSTNRELQQSAVRITGLESALRQREEEIRQIFDQSAAQRGAEMAALVADAKSEFDRQRQDLQTIASAVEAEFEKIKQKLGQNETAKERKEN